MPRLTTLVLGFIAAILCGSLFAADTQPTIQSFNKMPLAFTKNMGQWDDRVLFRANAGGAMMWFTKEGVTYQFTRRIEKKDASPIAGLDSPRLRKEMDRDSVEQLVLTAKFVGANPNPNPEVIAEGQMEYKCNYFIGNDPTKWRTDVPNYEAITLKDIYPNIDLKYSGDGNGQAAYEFIAAPGADITQIKVAYEGAEETSFDADGRMVVKTKWGDMIAGLKSPTSGAPSGSCAWWTSSSTTSPQDLAHGDLRQAGASLGTSSVELIYSTYLGGAGDDWGHAIALDGSGNAYVTGYTQSSSFPTQNPHQETNGGSWDVFVTKLSSSGNSLIYSTYLGGKGDDYGYGIAVDDSGHAYVTGQTDSSDFPTLNPYQTYQGPTGYNDAFVTKLSSSGNSLIYSTYLGGTNQDYGIGIAVDGAGNAYLTGDTYSTNFPTLNPYQTYQRYPDVFVTKFSSSGNTLIYSTYLGGEDGEYGQGIAVDGSGNVYVTGQTSSSDFPTLNPYQAVHQGGYRDAFVTKLSSSGNTLIYSTYLGGGDVDEGYGIAVDGSGNTYVTGETYSSNFPTLNPYQTYQGGDNVFVTKLSSTGNSLIYSTYLGGGDHDEAYDIAVDSRGNAYVTGETSSFNFPTLSPYQATIQGWSDVFVTKLSSTGNSLIYSTYLGGGGDGPERGLGIAVDDSGTTYVTGHTNSSDFPTQNPLQAAFQGGYNDAFVAKLYFDVADDVSDEMTPVSLPEKPALDQNYPNPFNPSTVIGYDLSRPSFVSLDIYDVLGRKVSTLINEHLTAGSKRVQWDGRDNTGAEVASGVYFYRLRIGDHMEVKKMVLLK